MRYLIHKSQFHELTARQEYLYDIFHLYFLPGFPEGSYIPLTPVGHTDIDILFVTGHTNYVLEYLDRFSRVLPEKAIVITSCYGKKFRKFSVHKVLYVPDTHKKLCMVHDGSLYGFGFDISDPELDFYNATGTITDRICTAYHRLR